MADIKEIIHCCDIRDESENPALADELFAVKGYDYSSLFDTETRVLRHFLYFDNEESAKLAKQEMGTIPDEWRAMGLSFAEIAVTQIEKKDWSEVWKKFFKIQHISEQLVIKPTWLEYEPKHDREVVVELDPGMSFGTGRHATTRFCLRSIANLAETVLAENPETTLLDAGCGSGILSIAALKLGFKNITAFDLDPDCLTCTLENMEMNELGANTLDLLEMDLAKSAETLKPFDIVIANILSHILRENREIIKSLVNPDGHLILAGILTQEYRELREAFEELGFREIREATEDEWTSGLFARERKEE